MERVKNYFCYFFRGEERGLFMKVERILLVSVFFLIASTVAFADRQLDEAATLQILQQLANQPKKTWIPSGTIEATHEEYRAAKLTDSAEVDNQIKQKIAEYQNSRHIASPGCFFRLPVDEHHIGPVRDREIHNKHLFGTISPVRKSDGFYIGRFYILPDRLSGIQISRRCR